MPTVTDIRDIKGRNFILATWMGFEKSLNRGERWGGGGEEGGGGESGGNIRNLKRLGCVRPRRKVI